MELQAELTDRRGEKRPLRVRCEPPGELRGLLRGLAHLREQVSALLDPLVQQERGGGCGGDEEDEEDEDEEENHVNAKACPAGPPSKRTKTHS